ncbi:MAG: hypothetical protein LBE67_12095 [Kocuria palustris]|nr:hypothetical protein [Kocuria palustris]
MTRPSRAERDLGAVGPSSACRTPTGPPTSEPARTGDVLPRKPPLATLEAISCAHAARAEGASLGTASFVDPLHLDRRADVIQ